MEEFEVSFQDVYGSYTECGYFGTACVFANSVEEACNNVTADLAGKKYDVVIEEIERDKFWDIEDGEAWHAWINFTGENYEFVRIETVIWANSERAARLQIAKDFKVGFDMGNADVHIGEL